MNPEQLPSQEASLVPRLLIGLVDGVCRFPKLVLTVALLVCAISGYAAYTYLEYHTQRSDLINPRKDSQQRWRQYVEEFGDDDDIVVVVKGCDRPRMEQALETLAAEVQKQPQHFDRLFYKVDLRSLRTRALLFLNGDQIKHIQGSLQNMNLLLDPPIVTKFDPLIGWKSLALETLLLEARQRVRKIFPDQPLSSEDTEFFTQLLGVSKSAMGVLDNPSNYQTPWNSFLAQHPEQQDLLAQPQYFFSEGDKKGQEILAFLLVRPIKEQNSFTAAQKSVDAMRAIVAGAGAKFADLHMGLTGLPVLETDEMAASQRDTNLASWLALGGVALLYLLVFRSLHHPLLTVGTLLVGTVWAMGWLTVTVGHLNILSATFAVMLIGMGDYGVLWVTRYEQERGNGADVVSATRNTAASVGSGILTASVTTAVAFFAAMLADFQAVAELGWIAGSGVLLCAFSCFTVLPAILRLIDRRDRPEPITIPVAAGSAWLPALAGRPRWVIGVSVALTAVLGIFACRVYYDHNLLHLQANDLESVKWEQTLIEHTAGASWHALSYTSTPEDALALKNRYRQLPGVSQVVEVASLVPRDQEQKLDQLRDIQKRLRNLPERGAVIPHALPKIANVKQELNGIINSLGLMVEANPRPLLTELWHSLTGLRATLLDLPPAVCAERLQKFEQRMTGDLAEDLHRLRDLSVPQPITVADLPEALRSRYVGQHGKWLLRVFGKECLWDYRPLEHFVEEIRSVDPAATGKPFSTLEGLRAMKNGFQWAGLYALIAIVLVLLADFRKPMHVLLALAPLAMGIILCLGIMGLCGWPLNPANMIVFPLILGVGVDNGVHVMHDYLSRRRQGRYALCRTIGRGIMVAALTTILGFGTLMLSSHRGLFGLGLSLTLGVTCCMLAALVFLPAVLQLLSLRYQTSKGQSRRRSDRAAA